MTDNIYNVNGYSDKELYDILDLINPSDRELEAKILHMIWKYDNMGNSNHLSTFFRNIYDRFFEDGEEESTVEGFTTDDVEKVIGSGSTATTGSNISAIPTANPNADKEKKDESAVLGYSFPLDYTKDTLNPLLKQTTKRIVSIDSQYRDRSKYPLSSQYTFNLSNPLKDVVNLRLYSIQIPYTWYTINDSYGSNFFYLKGNSPGIDKGYHDIKVEIGIGNYTAPDLITAINNSIIALKSDASYSDISFGDTKMTYDGPNSLATLDVKLKNRYDESFYSMEFSEWSTPRSKIVSGVDTTIRDISIPAFLGLDFKKYSPHGLISSVDSLPWPVPDSDSELSNYRLDASNNYITIVHYLPNNGDTSIEYISDPIHCTVLETIPITLSLPMSTVLHSKTRIKNDLNIQLGSNPKLMIQSSIDRIQTPTDSFAGTSYYLLNIRLNRMTTKNVPNSKVAVIFNDESTTSKIWTGQGSVFEFEQKKNELNTVVSKVRTVQRQINIRSSPSMYFKCIAPYFNGRNPNNTIISNTDLSMNDFSITMPTNTYTLNNYLSKINELLFATGNVNIETNPSTGDDIIGISINKNSKLMEFRGDIIKKFETANFKVSMAGTFLSNSLGLTSIETDLATQNIFEGTFNISGAGYTINTPYLMTLTPKTGTPNRYVPAYQVTPETVGKTYADISDLAAGLRASFVGFSDTLDGNQLVSGILVSIVQNGNTAKITLTIRVNKILSEASYKVSFIDASANPVWSVDDQNNSWAYNLKIADSSFNWNTYNVPGKSYTQYTSNSQLYVDTITLTNTNNKIRFDTVQQNDGGEGIYTDTSANNVLVTLPVKEYSRDELFTEINSQLNANPITRGSKFSGITIGNIDYTRLRFNINKIYDARDYRLVFYDPLSFAKCNAGSSSVRNTTWDSTLGWTIGFRNKTEYILSETAKDIENKDAHQTTYKINSTTGDTAVSVSIYNYFMIVLDDYNQSHMNAGVVTTTQSETDIPLPAYTNRALIRCDPITKLPITDTTSSTGANLTRSSIYAQQVISNEKEALKKNKQYAKGPFTKDVFALVPLKLSGLANNSVYVESGGTLQDQERTYFGPVNISRMTVKLVNDRGEIVNLNGANWSFSFICEQLYKK